MPNSNAPFGMRPVRRLDGTPYNGQVQEFRIAYNNTNKIGSGDLVKMLTSGYIDYAGDNDATGILGVFAGCEYYDDTQGKKVFMPAWLAPTLASTAVVKAYVIVDTELIFEIQSNSSTAIGISSLGSTAKITGAGNPDTASGNSKMALDASSLGTTATYPLLLVGFSKNVGDDPTSGYNVVEVVLNNTLFKSGQTGLS